MPEFTGWSGSPSILTARPLTVRTRMPQPPGHIRQMVETHCWVYGGVSVSAVASKNCRAPTLPSAVVAPPAAVILMKSRRDSFNVPFLVAGRRENPLALRSTFLLLTYGASVGRVWEKASKSRKSSILQSASKEAGMAVPGWPARTLCRNSQCSQNEH